MFRNPRLDGGNVIAFMALGRGLGHERDLSQKGNHKDEPTRAGMQAWYTRLTDNFSSLASLMDSLTASITASMTASLGYNAQR